MLDLLPSAIEKDEGYMYIKKRGSRKGIVKLDV